LRVYSIKDVGEMRTVEPAMEAVLTDGPLRGTSLEVEPVGGRPPSTIDVSDADGRIVRYCLAEWTQEGMSAEYSYLYPV
jgi:hypothetical protein